MKYFKNTSWLAMERLLRTIVQFIVTIYVARYLGPEEFGLLNYVISFVGIVAVIAPLGVDGILVKELVKHPKLVGNLMGTSFWLVILGTVIVYAVLFAITPFTESDDLTTVLIIIVASSVIFQAFNIIDSYFQAHVLSKYVVIAQVFQLTISSLFKLALVVLQAELIWFALMVLLDSIFLALFLSVIYLVKVGRKKYLWRFDRKLARGLLKNSWPLMLSSIFVSVYMKIDQVMIKEMVGGTEVGYYAAAVKISEAWYFVPMIISSSIFPAIIKARSENKELYYSGLQKLYSLMVWGSISIALLVTFFSEFLIDILFGGQYSHAAEILNIHIWAGVFVALGVASSKYLLAEELQKVSFYRTFVGALINIILNLLLIPGYGAVGAAIATLLSYMAVIFGVLMFTKDDRLKLMGLMMLKAFIFRGTKIRDINR